MDDEVGTIFTWYSTGIALQNNLFLILEVPNAGKAISFLKIYVLKRFKCS